MRSIQSSPSLLHDAGVRVATHQRRERRHNAQLWKKISDHGRAVESIGVSLSLVSRRHTVRGMPLVASVVTRGVYVRQLGSALLALALMLACAAISDRVVPAVASEETPLLHAARSGVGRSRVIAARAAEVRTIEVPASRSLEPRAPDQLVLLVAGLALMGLGGALRTQRRGGRR